MQYPLPQLLYLRIVETRTAILEFYLIDVARHKPPPPPPSTVIFRCYERNDVSFDRDCRFSQIDRRCLSVYRIINRLFIICRAD